MERWLGRNVVNGAARNLVIDPDREPEVGDILKTSESRFGHLALLTEVATDTVTVLESNVPLGSERVGTRTFKRSDSRIVGYAQGLY